MKILFIEDDDAFANVVMKALSDFTIERTSNLTDGLRLLAQVKDYDAVLLDLGLPDSHGMETFTTLHKIFPHVPVVVLSGSVDKDMLHDIVRAGAVFCVAKWEHNGRALGNVVRNCLLRAPSRMQLHDQFDRCREIIGQMVAA